MSDSYVKDIVYDLIQSKLRIKELEDKLCLLESENSKLTSVNIELTKEVNKWKSHVVSYIDDYRNLYVNSVEIPENTTVIEEVNEVIYDNDEIKTINETKEASVTPDDTTKKNRNEYMKEYMRNKRKQHKEEIKKLVVVKK